MSGTRAILPMIEALPLAERLHIFNALAAKYEDADLSVKAGRRRRIPAEEAVARLSKAMERVTGCPVCGRSRRQPLPCCRMMIARQAWIEGYTYTEISGAIGLSTSTLSSGLAKLAWELDNPSLNSDIAEIWNEFQKQLHDNEIYE